MKSYIGMNISDILMEIERLRNEEMKMRQEGERMIEEALKPIIQELSIAQRMLNLRLI